MAGRIVGLALLATTALYESAAPWRVSGLQVCLQQTDGSRSTVGNPGFLQLRLRGGQEERHVNAMTPKETKRVAAWFKEQEANVRALRHSSVGVRSAPHRPFVIGAFTPQTPGHESDRNLGGDLGRERHQGSGVGRGGMPPDDPTSDSVRARNCAASKRLISRSPRKLLQRARIGARSGRGTARNGTI